MTVGIDGRCPPPGVANLRQWLARDARNLSHMNTCYLYVLASRDHRHISFKVTTDLRHGVRHHRRRIARKLGRKKVYQKLVYVERFDGLSRAVAREREISDWTRSRLMYLVSRKNPTWKPISIRWYLGLFSADRPGSRSAATHLKRAPGPGGAA